MGEGVKVTVLEQNKYESEDPLTSVKELEMRYVTDEGVTFDNYN